MKPLRLALLLVASLWFATGTCHAAQVRLAGDARIQGGFFKHRFFTGYAAAPSRAEDSFIFWERLRVRADFVTDRDVRFRFGFRLNNTPWGAGTLTVDNPAVSLDVNQAYLHWTLPDTDVEVSLGLQPLSLPQSSFFFDSPVLGTFAQNTSSAAVTFSAPLIRHLAAFQGGFARLLDSSSGFQPVAASRPDVFDILFASVPVTPTHTRIIPWIAVGWLGSGASLPNAIKNGMVSPGFFTSPGGYASPCNAVAWSGLALEHTGLDPWRFTADVILGSAAFTDASRFMRRGFFLDASFEYSGFDLFIPQLSAWYASGEDSDVSNGSERLPSIRGYWNTSTPSMLFDGGQALFHSNLFTNPLGSCGLSLAAKDYSHFTGLFSSLSATVATGTSSPQGLRKAVQASGGSGRYLTMGKDLALGESVLGLNLDHRLVLNDHLVLHLETGWARFLGGRAGVWNGSRPLTHLVQDAWRCQVGLRYAF